MQKATNRHLWDLGLVDGGGKKVVLLGIKANLGEETAF